jgi:hypothetical protein
MCRIHHLDSSLTALGQTMGSLHGEPEARFVPFVWMYFQGALQKSPISRVANVTWDLAS